MSDERADQHELAGARPQLVEVVPQDGVVQPDGAQDAGARVLVVSGQIPPQKSDLTHFSVALVEPAAGGRYLELFWRRVQEPNGTTNMDFEFNNGSERLPRRLDQPAVQVGQRGLRVRRRECSLAR